MRNALLVLILALLLLQASYIAYRNSRPPAPPAQVVQKADDKKINESRTKKRSLAEVGNEIVRGVVYNYNGTPAKNCTVLIAQVPPRDALAATVQRMPRWFERTDGAGRFVARTLPAGVYTVLARTDRTHAAARAHLDTGGAAADLMLWLRNSQTLRGVVLDALQAPIANAAVIPLDQYPGIAESPFMALPASTGADGKFMFTYLPQGPWRFLAVDRGPTAHRTVAGGGDDAALRIVLGTGAPLKGTLSEDEEGRPLAQVKLQLTETDQKLVRYSATTDSAGSFEFGALFPARYELRLNSNRYVLPGGVMVLEPDQFEQVDALSVNALRAGRIRGRVLDAAERSGVHDVLVTAASRGTPVHRVETRTDTAGYYTLEGLAPIAYALQLHTAAHARVVKDAGVIALRLGQAAKGTTWALRDGVRVSGQVVDTAGRPVADASVRTGQGSAAAGGAPTETAVKSRATRSASDGTFVLDDVDDQTPLYIGAEKMGMGSRVFGPEPLDAGGLSNLTLTLDQSVNSAIAGRVLDASGEAAPGAYVVCFADAPELPPLQTVRVDAAGGFRLTGLPAGSCALVAAGALEDARSGLAFRLSLGPEEFKRDVELRLP